MVKPEKTIEESVVQAMDGTDAELFPFLPYILQDLWEIGAYIRQQEIEIDVLENKAVCATFVLKKNNSK